MVVLLVGATTRLLRSSLLLLEVLNDRFVLHDGLVVLIRKVVSLGDNPDVPAFSSRCISA